MELPKCSEFDDKSLSYITQLIYLKLTPFVSIIGIIGNGIGFVISHLESNYSYKVTKNKNERSVDSILVKTFYIVNIINCLLMIGWPIFDSYAFHLGKKIWFDLIWHRYVIQCHIPLLTTFLNYNFLISLLFAIDQFIVITHPYKYKIYRNAKTAKWGLILCFIYSLILCMPIAGWYKLTVIHCLKENIDNSSCTLNELYTRDFFYPVITWKSNIWTSYLILRVFASKIIPFFVEITLHCVTIKKRRKIFNSRFTVEISRCENRIDSNSFTCNTTNNQENLGENLKMIERKLDIDRKLKTNILFIIQFACFMLPSAIYYIIAAVHQSGLSSNALNTIWSITFFLEFLFVSLTFYVNLLFNKNYRVYVLRTIKPHLSNIKITLQKVANIFKKQ
ncbi:unnamed protein product [Gordionus sp. m RMFG-2023]